MAKRTKKRRGWLAAEVKALRSGAQQLVAAAKIAKLLKRTEGAVRQKALALGVSLNSQRLGKKKTRPAKKK